MKRRDTKLVKTVNDTVREAAELDVVTAAWPAVLVAAGVISAGTLLAVYRSKLDAAELLATSVTLAEGINVCAEPDEQVITLANPTSSSYEQHRRSVK